MHFPPFSESKFIFIKRLWNCDLCSGVWVYFIVALLLGVDEFIVGTKSGIYVIDCFLVGGISSFLVHIFSFGWQNKFFIIEIE
jgi:hypothetical protein